MIGGAMTQPILQRPSPNHNSRGGQAVDILLLHYTGMQSAEAALSRLLDPEAAVSAHYVIDEDGATLQLVEEGRRAWHAGVAFWHGACDINARSIGIELVNPGHEFGYRPFPEAQMKSLIALARDILGRHPIPPARVLGHSDVAPGRKDDPGELLDWPRLAAEGIGLWHGDPPAGPEAADQAQAAGLLEAYGYGLEGTPLEKVVTAFQRHFQPETVSGIADAGSLARLTSLLRLSGKPLAGG
jgi:N-acetylmuramoyl-L-alanine amidase